MKQKSVREPFTALIIPDGRTRIYHSDSQLAKQKDENGKIVRDEIEIPAKDVFIGRMSALCKQYAEQFYPDNWFILTTNNQTGQPCLVHPDQFIKGEYDNPPYPIPDVPKGSKKPSYWQPFTDQGTLDKKIITEAKTLGLLSDQKGAPGNYRRVIFLGNGTESECWRQENWDSCINDDGYESWYEKYQNIPKEKKQKDDGEFSRLFTPYVTQKYQYSPYVNVIETLFENTGIWLEFPLLDYEYESQMISRISDAVYRDFPLHQSQYSLKNISITNLFRMGNKDFNDFNYSDVPLGNDSHLQIITAPNGFGKSTIFRLIRAIFRGNLQQISSIPFDDATIIISVGSEDLTLSIKKSYSADQHEKNYSISINGKPKFTILRKELDEQFRDLERWMEQNPEKIKELRNVIPPLLVRFLSSERLFHDPLKDMYPFDLLVQPDECDLTDNKSRGELLADSFRKRLDGVLTDYAIVSHKIDTTFPVHLMEYITSQQGPFERYPHLKKSFTELDCKREVLEKRDFLSFRNWYSKEKDPFTAKKTALDSVQLLSYQDFLQKYLEEQSEKYKVFDWMNDRCRKLEDIINSLLIYTRIRIRKDTGFAFYNLNKKSGRYHELDVSQISSGEMQQIVMYYDFLFNCDPGTLVLIDEPEISLHIVWQEQYLEKLQEINAVNKLNFLVATHSPYIINTFADLAYDLEGDAYVRKSPM